MQMHGHGLHVAHRTNQLIKLFSGCLVLLFHLLTLGLPFVPFLNIAAYLPSRLFCPDVHRAELFCFLPHLELQLLQLFLQAIDLFFILPYRLLFARQFLLIRLVFRLGFLRPFYRVIRL